MCSVIEEEEGLLIQEQNLKGTIQWNFAIWDEYLGSYGSLRPRPLFWTMPFRYSNISGVSSGRCLHVAVDTKPMWIPYKKTFILILQEFDSVQVYNLFPNNSWTFVITIPGKYNYIHRVRPALVCDTFSIYSRNVVYMYLFLLPFRSWVQKVRQSSQPQCYWLHH